VPSPDLPALPTSRAKSASPGRPSPAAAAHTAESDRLRWERPALAGLLIAAAVLYLSGLGASGYANDYYAAAVQAGTQSWKAWFFGSLDAGNLITVDKPPAALWVMGLSARIFGFGSWSMLVPQALMGVGSVALLYATVRRWSGPVAGLTAGGIFAVTPAAVVMFRFNNPDPLLVLLLLCGAYCVVRAVEAASTRWLVLAGTAIGAAFLAKMLQSFLVLPAFALVYLIAAPTTLRRRIWQLLVAAAAMVGAAGWWVAAVSLWPASARPYIGGSTTNSVLQLALGYNGLGRVFGGDSANGGGARVGGPGGADGGGAGLGRLFGPGVGEEVSWLLPAALIALAVGLVLTVRRSRTDRIRAALILWGGWLLVTGVVFSFMGGKFHPYYTVALAPAIAAICAVAGRQLWDVRDTMLGRVAAAAITGAAGAWSFVLLARTPLWAPGLRYAVAVLTVAGAVALLLGPMLRDRLAAGGATVAVATAVLAAVLGTAGYAAVTATVPHTGADPAPGPANGRTGDNPDGTGQTQGGGTTTAKRAPVVVGPELIALLRSTRTTWAAAAAGAQAAAPLELATGRPVMGIGGFTGTDQAPTLAQFQRYVSSGRVSYFVAGGTEDGKAGSGRGTAGPAAQITAWVAATYPSTTADGQSVYDLTPN
jgi:4-amino-4-deoxy-L-arabinose transferase-like glycosyltransferase